MFKNYLVITLRELWKSKYFSMLNILGLGISISACLLVMMLIQNANEYDRFHPHADRTYRILTQAQRKGGILEPYATSSFALAESLVRQSTSVEHWVPLVRRFSGELKYEDNQFDFSGLATTSDFFNVFGFELASGHPQKLDEPNTIILTSTLAKKLFPLVDPIGKNIQWSGYPTQLNIIGVLKDFPGKTHLEFEALTSIRTVEAEGRNSEFGFKSQDYKDYYTTYSFLQLKPFQSKSEVEARLNALAAERYKTMDLESRDLGYHFELQPLLNITPGRMLSNSMGNGMPSMVLWFLSFLGLIILISAGFNHTNMSLAKAVNRIKEIGIRKVSGALRKHIFAQFLIEAVIISILATVVGFICLKLAIPFISRMKFIVELNISLEFSNTLLMWYLAFALVTGVIIGILPSLILSSLNTLSAIQAKGNIRMFKGIHLRRAIIVTQLSMSLLFLFVITGSVKQLNYAIANTFGADKDYVINLDVQGHDAKKVITELLKLPQIETISGTSIVMGTNRDSKVDVKANVTADPIGIRDYFIDENFLKNFNLQILAGLPFEQDYTLKHERSAIVNETFLSQFNLGSPEEALQKSIYLDTFLVAIKAVVKDFRFKPVDYAVEPLVLRYDPSQIQNLHLQIHPAGNPSAIEADIKNAWAKIDPRHAVKWIYYSDDVKLAYSVFNDLVKVILFFAILAILICLMGLMGIVTYSLNIKRKEIAIRKVVGAKLKNLSWTLSHSYLRWLIMALMIAIPLATFIITQLLHQFALRISWSLTWFIPGISIMISCLCLTVGLQVFHAIRTNPIRALRCE